MGPTPPLNLWDQKHLIITIIQPEPNPLPSDHFGSRRPACTNLCVNSPDAAHLGSGLTGAASSGLGARLPSPTPTQAPALRAAGVAL